MKKHYTTEDYICQVAKIHKNKYFYTKTQYLGSNKEIIITCPEHGDFTRLATYHKSGKGCPKCIDGRNTSNTKDFISKANEVHNNKYDYSLVEYINCDTPVIIICPIHGKFNKNPYSHILGKSCNLCNKKDKIRIVNKDSFTDIANRIHNNRYSYDKKNYIKSHLSVTITCPIHGDFEQIPSTHIHGKAGCPQCSFDKSKITTEKFIEKAKLKHGERYNYSKSKYERNNVPIIITCKEHGDFLIKPSSFLNGSGCKKCYETNRVLTIEEFIVRAKKVQGNKYDYSKVDIKGCNFKVEIICPVHGSFLQNVSNHLNGYNCPKCTNDKNTLTTEEFVKRAELKHGKKYDYSRVIYKGCQETVEIVCNKHGSFFPKAYSHLSKAGCPTCNESELERATRVFFEKNNIRYEAQKKFPDCRNKNPLPFDFYLPEFNICIECDGDQHTSLERYAVFIKKYTNPSDDEIVKGWNKVHGNDLRKDIYCIQNRISLIRVPYTRHIEKYLNENLLPILILKSNYYIEVY